MRYAICAIYDKATSAYMRPFTAQSPGQASRMFEDLLQDENHEVTRHAEDYTLFQIGWFDDSTGSLDEMEPAPLMRAHEAVARLRAMAAAREAQANGKTIGQ